MWWGEFERQLSEAFFTYDKRKGREVHSNEMKLRILRGKVQTDFLQPTKAPINLELAKVPMILTYDNALG